MSSTWKVVTMGNHALNFLLREATPANPIFTQLVIEGLLLEIHLDIMEKFLFLVRVKIIGEDSRSSIVCVVGEPWACPEVMPMRCSSRKASLMGAS